MNYETVITRKSDGAKIALRILTEEKHEEKCAENENLHDAIRAYKETDGLNPTTREAINLRLLDYPAPRKTASALNIYRKAERKAGISLDVGMLADIVFYDENT